MKKKKVMCLLALAGVLALSVPVMSMIPYSVACAAESGGIPVLNQNIFSEGNFSVPNDASLASSGNLYLGITALDNAQYVTECQGAYYPTMYESEEFEGEVYSATYTKYEAMSYADAVSQSMQVPAGTSFYFDANPASIATLAEYNEASKNIYLIVIKDGVPVGRVAFSDLNSVIGAVAGVGTGSTGGTGSGSIMQDSLQAPVITFSEIPERTGTEFKLTMYSDINAVLTFNGKNNGSLVLSDTFIVSGNGSYSYSAITADGKEISGVLDISCFTGDTVAPLDDRDNVWNGTGVENEIFKSGDEAGSGSNEVSSGTSEERLYQTGIEDSLSAVSGVLGLGGASFLLAGALKKRKGGIDEE